MSPEKMYVAGRQAGGTGRNPWTGMAIANQRRGIRLCKKRHAAVPRSRLLSRGSHLQGDETGFAVSAGCSASRNLTIQVRPVCLYYGQGFAVLGWKVTTRDRFTYFSYIRSSEPMKRGAT